MCCSGTGAGANLQDNKEHGDDGDEDDEGEEEVFTRKFVPQLSE